MELNLHPISGLMPTALQPFTDIVYVVEDHLASLVTYDQFTTIMVAIASVFGSLVFIPRVPFLDAKTIFTPWKKVFRFRWIAHPEVAKLASGPVIMTLTPHGIVSSPLARVGSLIAWQGQREHSRF